MLKRSLQFVLFSFISVQISIFPQTIIQNILDSVNGDSLVYFAKELSGDVPTVIGGTPYTIISRHKNQPGNDKASQYIFEKLSSYGLTSYYQSFSATGKNVYAVQTGTEFPNQKLVICAHFDDMPSGTTAPGADDNASGTASVIEAARVFSNYSFPFTIIYALWDEEEQGLVGSNYYASNAATTGDSIIGVINLDMIAWDSNSDNKANIHTRSVGTSLSLADKMIEMNSTFNIGLSLVIKNPGSTYSDHASFWSNNYGAILLIEDGNDFNAYYHTTSDIISAYNIPYLIKSAKLAYATLASLALNNAVPVELLSFTSEISGNNILLLWETASELNNKGFEIHKSIDLKNWEVIGFVDGAGSSVGLNSYRFMDTESFSLKSYYRIKQTDYDGTFKIYGPIQVDVSELLSYSLEQNYPNPFNPITQIKYSIEKEGSVTLKVFDILGNEVGVLVNEVKPAGKYSVNFNAGSLSSGTYFYIITTENFISAKKMLLVK